MESTNYAILTRPEAGNPTLGPRPPNPINYSLRRQDVFFQVDLKKNIIEHSSPWSPWAIFEAKHKDFKAFWRFPGSQLASPAGLRDVFQVNLKRTFCGGAIIAPKTEKSATNHDFAALLRI